MKNLLEGKVAIVTGGCGALGAGTARGLAEAGAKVVIADIKEDRVKSVADEFTAAGYEVLGMRCDVTNRASIDEMVAKTVEIAGGVDILINNAAIYPSGPWMAISEDEWDQVFAVNIRGYFHCAQSCYPHMKARGGGKIINMSSITFLLGHWDKLLHYVSTKGAVVGFTRALARELGSDNIQVNCIAPGAFPTDAEKIHPDPEGYNAHVLANQSIKRRGNAGDIANAVLFFSSHMSDFITGQTLPVDGGWMTN